MAVVNAYSHFTNQRFEKNRRLLKNCSGMVLRAVSEYFYLQAEEIIVVQDYESTKLKWKSEQTCNVRADRRKHQAGNVAKYCLKYGMGVF
jgi:hypothetical protein